MKMARHFSFDADDVVLSANGDGVRLAIIVIDGQPVPQARPRVNYLTRHVYVPGGDIRRDFAGTVLRAVQAVGGAVPFLRRGQFVDLDCTFYEARPRSHYRADGITLTPRAPTYPIRCDLDNCLKFLLDAVKGSLYYDDKHVVDVHAHKRYCLEGEGPKTRIVIRSKE